jgi:1,4-dihydroxy-6-naphthoate synthase
MTPPNPYRLAYSSCPNDTFMFKAIALQRMDLSGFRFDITVADVETLNLQARTGKHHITKLSVAALGHLSDQYALLRCGAALGRGCGPLVVTRPGTSLKAAAQGAKIGIPGMGTTACLLFRFFMADRFPGCEPCLIPMPFERIMPAVLDRSLECGVIIHEGRFVYEGLGLEKTVDLGQWWEESTGLPIPLGCIAVRRDMDTDTALRIQTLIRDSIDHAFRFPDDAADYIRDHAQELDASVIKQHIALYVNDFSRDLGPEGDTAVREFLNHARTRGMMPEARYPLFACPEFPAAP